MPGDPAVEALNSAGQSPVTDVLNNAPASLSPQDAQLSATMTHQAPPPNPAGKILESIRAFPEKGLVGAMEAAGVPVPGWAHSVGEEIRDPDLQAVLGMAARWDPAEWQKVLKLYKSGMPPSQIAKQISGRTAGNIKGKLQREGEIETARQGNAQFTSEEITKMQDMLQHGETQKDIAELMGRTPGSAAGKIFRMKTGQYVGGAPPLRLGQEPSLPQLKSQKSEFSQADYEYGLRNFPPPPEP
jgi:hypothetical protein